MDKFRKWKSLYSATANSFGTGEGVTITPSSVAGLPTDTEITLTFDRQVEGKLERIRGTVSGGNFVVSSGGRGADGTTEQAHTSPTVEHVPNASDINDLVDGIVAEHNQDGTHAATIVKTTGSQTLTDKTLTTPTLTTPTIQTRWVAKGEYDNGNSGTSKEIDWANGDRQVVTLTDNCTFTYANASAGQVLTLRLIQDAGGTNTVTLPTSMWAGGAAGEFSTDANSIDLLVVNFDGTNYLTQLAAGFAVPA